MKVLVDLVGFVSARYGLSRLGVNKLVDDAVKNAADSVSVRVKAPLKPRILEESVLFSIGDYLWCMQGCYISEQINQRMADAGMMRWNKRVYKTLAISLFISLYNGIMNRWRLKDAIRTAIAVGAGESLTDLVMSIREDRMVPEKTDALPQQRRNYVTTL